MFKKAILLLCVFVMTISVYSQNGSRGINTEICVFAGPVFFKTDYGERGNYENFIKNNGYAVGASVYLSNLNIFNTLEENLKLRLDLSFTKADFKHYGKYVDPASNSLFSNQLRGMYGSTSSSSLGFQVEYYPFQIENYSRSLFSPYLSLGPQINYVSVTTKSTLGELGTDLTTPQKYIGGYKNGEITAASLTGAIGTRYVISDYHGIFADLRAQYFFSDWADGLNPNKTIYKENKSNDWCVGFIVGYVYYLN